MDNVVSVLSIVWATIIDGVRSIDRNDIIAVAACLVVGAVAIVIRDHAESWTTRYINRFVRHGLKRIAVRYAISLAAVLLASVFALIELSNFMPEAAQLVILTSAVWVIIFMSTLGWQARGPSKPNIMRFGRIFYEPAVLAISPMVVPKWSTIIDKAPQIWHRVADVALRFMS